MQKLRDAVVQAFADPELRETWAKLGAEPGGSPPAAFKALVDKDVARWAKVVREAKITLDSRQRRELRARRSRLRRGERRELADR